MSERSIPARAALVAAASALAVGAVGGTLTRIGPWYRALKKPGWTPPDPAFGVIWTAIFALAAIAGVLAWRGARNPVGRVLWSLLFFTLERPDWALAEVGALWLSILALIVFSWRLSRAASLLLTPYLVWVSIAMLLNLDIVHLNGPFG